MWLDVSLSFMYRVARGVSLSTTCLLNVFQAIKLCSRTSRWMKHKVRSRKYLHFCCVLCWLLYILVKVFILKRVIRPRNSKNISAKKKKLQILFVTQIRKIYGHTTCHPSFFLWCYMSGPLCMDWWLHGHCPDQAQAMSLAHSQQQTFPQTFQRGQSHTYPPGPGKLLCLLLFSLLHFSSSH